MASMQLSAIAPEYGSPSMQVKVMEMVNIGLLSKNRGSFAIADLCFYMAICK